MERAGANVLYKIPKVVIGENTSFMGEEKWLESHGVRLDVRDAPQCLALMREFMDRNPGLWAKNIGE